MREEYSQHIHHTTNEVQSGRACACVHKRTSSKQQRAMNQMADGQMQGPLLICIWARRVPAWATAGCDRTALYTVPWLEAVLVDTNSKAIADHAGCGRLMRILCSLLIILTQYKRQTTDTLICTTTPRWIRRTSPSPLFYTTPPT